MGPRSSQRHSTWIGLALALALACTRGAAPPPAQPRPADPATDGSDGAAPAPTPGSAIVRPTAFDGWTVEPAASGGLRVRNHFADVVRSRYVLFGADYRWADPQVQTREDAGVAGASIASTPLDLRGHATLSLDDPRDVTITWQLELGRALQNVSGGGLELDVTLAPGLWGGRAPSFALDDGDRRLRIGSGDDAMELRLEGDAFGFVREPGNPGRVRAILLRGDLPAGTREATLHVTLPASTRVQPSMAARLAASSSASWPTGVVSWDGAPVDVGDTLGREPAGRHGRVRADGDALEFEDGTPVRFWGTNVAAYALFDGDKPDIERQARRLAALGYNLVRLHHHDSAWVEPNIFEPGSRRLREASLDAIDWWIKCLGDAGIYVWLDVHVGRRFRSGDGIGGFDELPDGDGRGFSYVDPRIESLMTDFASRYLARSNRYTQRALQDDPTVALVLLTNENDITHHFGPLMLPGSGRPVHEALMRSRIEPFAKRHHLPLDATLQTWAPGPAKLAMAELEHRWGTRAIAALRKLGVRAPIVTTSLWGDEPLWSLPSLQAGDAIDVHSYGDEGSLGTNPHFEPNFLAMAAMAQVLGRPHLMSEWNVPLPARDRQVAPLYVAAIAALQGWDAPLLYAHVQDPLRAPSSVAPFSTWVDPALVALAPAASIMFRRGDVAAARETLVLTPALADVYGAPLRPETAAALRTGYERSRVVLALPDAPELSWDAKPKLPRGATVVKDLDRDLLPRDGHRVVSDTGEITRDWAEGTLVIDTPRSRAAAGWIGGLTIPLGDGWVALDLPSAAFALTALDDAPLQESAKLLVTIVGQAEHGEAGRVPFRSEPPRGRFALRSTHALVAVPLSGGSGTSGADLSARVPLRPRREGDLQVFDLAGPVPTHWYLLVPEGSLDAGKPRGAGPPAR
ncbi:MAG: glycosyl hydrolase family 5 [Deltaproteobacteria bacterium]|nr:glycosyl hydrolase family 5 [Deltaproteobacteria bacterium]MBK8718618.1 glycosyl hydrolase family 5 [Deltaproteobacteria bacterium]MBP7290465.1 hypothetical protein [Nannocystaceae bacterium]